MSPERATSDPYSGSDVPPSLAEASIGDQVRVERILFELVRGVCTDLGLSEGTRLRVEDRSGGTVVVRDEFGERAQLPSHYAYFVRITAEGG